MGTQRLLTGSKACLQLAEGRAECYAALCEYEPGYLCAENILTVLVPPTGAQDGIQALQDMTWGGTFSFDPSVAHLLAHIVGRETAKRYNLSGEAFLTCPIDFDYGCYHGFLEAGFLRGYKPNELITEMCESMPITPAYAKVACYHGSGHALVMHYSYGLYEPLKQCDMLISYEHQDACRSGVFMENVNGVNGLKTTEEPDNGFRDDNPLAPCSDLDEKYKVRCYENQMPYWLESLDYTLEDLIAVCDIVEEGYVDECVHSVGAYSIYPGNQYKLLGFDFEGDFIDKTIYICNQFPKEHRMRCYAPAIQQNFVYHGIEVISGFCEKIDAVYRDECWRIIGGDLAGKVENNDDLIATCLKAPDQYRGICLDPYTQREGYADASEASFLQNNTKNVAKTQKHLFFLRLRQYAVSFFNIVVHFFRNVFSDSYDSTTNGVNEEEFFIAGIKKCLHSEEDQVVCYAALCEYEPSYLCAERIIDTVTALMGPERGIAVLGDLSKSGSFDLSGFLQDGHQLAHVVGRSTARNWGSDGEMFSRCPTDFSYGCQHGFFEGVAASEISLFDIMIAVCGTFEDTESREKSDCYHASGHGIMMSVSYDLKQALSICRYLKNVDAVVDCESGVFMENALGAVGDRIPEEYNGFKLNNPLSPCNSLEKQTHRSNCYAYHHRIYLPAMYSTSLEDLVKVCFSAGDDERMCLSNLAMALTAEAGDVVVSEFLPETGDDRAERAGILCKEFPEEYVRMCYESAGNRLMYSIAVSESEETSVEQFCNVAGEYQSLCFSVVRKKLIYQLKVLSAIKYHGCIYREPVYGNIRLSFVLSY